MARPRLHKIPVLPHAFARALDDGHHPLAARHGLEVLIGLASHLVDHRRAGIRDRLEVVAAFERRDDFAVATFGGQPFDAPHHLTEALLGHLHLAERIAPMTIESRRNQDELRLERAPDRNDQLVEDAHIFRVAKFGRHRRVDRVAETLAGADFLHRAGARIVRELMRRDVQDLGAVVEDFLRTVAMMEVPVDHHHAPEALVPDEPFGRDRDVVEEAKSHRAARQRMMPGRPHNREGILRGAIQDRLDRRQHASGCEQRGR